MPPTTFQELLDKAASECGIEPGFWDIFGKYHTTTTEAKQAILRSMGIAADFAESLAQAMAERTRREWRRLAPFTIVTGEAGEIVLTLQARAEQMGETVRVTIKQEDGRTSDHDVKLGELPQTGVLEMDGQTWLRKQARISVRLPFGYHEIHSRCGNETAVTHYVVTPERAYLPPQLAQGGKAAGFAVSLYGVRSERNWGCGDFTDLRTLVDWAVDELGAGFVALNPLHAIPNRRPFNTSPYLPNCIFYQNFLYLDVEVVEDFARSRRARALRATPAVEAEIRDLRATPFVEYERVSALKLRFLKLAFVQFLREWRKGGPRARDFQAFQKREGRLLERFALYAALDEHLHRANPDVWIWPQWPAAYQDPNSAETHAFARKHWRSVMFYQYLQWLIDQQLRAAQQRALDRQMSIGLYHDLALATDKYGSDLWAHRPYFAEGCRVGSPPDDFSPNGQDWGFPPPNSARHREDGYRLFAESIRQNCRQGGALRIDHVMRLFRLYWIPDGLDASQGAYVRERAEEYLRVLALESVRNRVLIVGEDLGTVEPEAREALAKFGILSYRLFYFEKTESGGFRRNSEYPRQALVASTTHDLPTLAGFWTAADVHLRLSTGMIDEAAAQSQLEAREREKQAMLDVLFNLRLMPGNLPRDARAYGELTGELHHAVIGFLALTPSQLLVVNQEDLTKETAQQNLPGATWQYPNWGRKMRYSLEELRSDETARNFAVMVRDWIAQSGRRNQTGHTAEGSY